AEFGDEYCRADSERHGIQHGQHGDACRASDQRQHAVAHVALRRRIPLGATEKFKELEAVKQKRGAFAEHKEENAKDKQDSADAAQTDQQFNRNFGERLPPASNQHRQSAPFPSSAIKVARPSWAKVRSRFVSRSFGQGRSGPSRCTFSQGPSARRACTCTAAAQWDTCG